MSRLMVSKIQTPINKSQTNLYIGGLKQIVSISLIITMFGAIMGVDVGIHKCGGEVVAVALYSAAEPCAHATAKEAKKDLPACHRHLSEEKEDSDKGCCEDEYFDQEVLEIEVIHDNSQWSALVDIDFSAELLIVKETLVQIELDTPHYLFYKPPLIESNLLVLQQAFLI